MNDTGGESRVARLEMNWSDVSERIQCPECGLEQEAMIKTCQTCETEMCHETNKQTAVDYLKYLRDMQNFDEHVHVGYQQLLEDETVRAPAHLTEDSAQIITQVKTTLRNLNAGEAVAGEQIQDALNEIYDHGLLDKQVLQTHIVGRKEILNEGELWKPVVQKEVNDLLASNTLYPVSPDELKRLQESGAVLETIPGKLICSRITPDGNVKLEWELVAISQTLEFRLKQVLVGWTR